ncbi:hypothetical protein ACQ4PT_058529 [Festuca glaucescens]
MEERMLFISPAGRPAPDPLKTQISAPTSRPPTPADEDRVLRPYNSIDNSKLSRASKRFSPASARVARKPGPAETSSTSSSRRSLSPLFDPELLKSIERDLSEEGAHIKRVIGSDKPKQPKVVPAIVAEGRCPPGGADAVMLYTTTLRGICKTFEECNAVRAAIEPHDVKLIERDVSMDSGYMEELRLLLGARELRVSAVFVRGKHVGGTAEVTKMEEEGKLKALLQGLPRERVWCAGCADVRFIMCRDCNGSRKMRVDGDQKETVQCASSQEHANNDIYYIWNHGHKFGGGFECQYCNMKSNGGATRFRQHLSCVSGEVRQCPNVPRNIRDAMRDR